MMHWFLPTFRVACLILLFPAFSRAADTRADFLKLIAHSRVPLSVQITPLPSTDAIAEFHFTYITHDDQRVPGILLKSVTAPTGRRPVVIALHGTGGKKTDMLPLLRQLAAKGFIGVAIDGPYHGERATAKGTADYQAAILQAWHDQKQHPFFFDTVWDVMRLIDYLQTRDDVDPARIGLYGVSKGGIETYLTAAADPRVTVAVPCIGLESFAWAADNNAWQSRIGTIQIAFNAAAKEADVASPDGVFVHQFYAKVASGIDGEFDGPSMAPLIAPRPLLAINGDSDARTPLPGLKLCTDAASAAYRAAGAEDHFLERIQPHTAHKVNPDSQAAAVDWFVRWLKP